jgi:Pyruvate/2-oxoacid:ferredoxin oxidoreductase gamma subunit
VKHDILLIGKGGEGIVSLAQIMGNAALDCGYEVTTYEDRGHAKRGGIVIAHVRIGHVAPKISTADTCICFCSEHIPIAMQYIKNNGVIIENRTNNASNTKIQVWRVQADKNYYTNTFLLGVFVKRAIIPYEKIEQLIEMPDMISNTRKNLESLKAGYHTSVDSIN